MRWSTRSTGQPRERGRWIASGLIAAAAVIALACDRSGRLSGVRAGLHDVLSPGRLLLLAVSGVERVRRPPSAESPGAADTAAVAEASLRASERQRRQLLIRLARLRNRLRVAEASEITETISGSGPLPLVQFSVVPARVLSRSGMPDRLRELIVDAGADTGATRSELIVDGDGLLLDQGQAAGIAAGARVLEGAVVLGRIARAARWVSLVEPVTSETFSARVQLVRATGDESHFGAEGILSGSGSGDCVITGIPYTEPVAVGDEVVSVDIDGVRGPRLSFGRVTQAEFLSGGEWQIRVQPAARPAFADQVAVVRMQLDPRSARPADAADPSGEGGSRP